MQSARADFAVRAARLATARRFQQLVIIAALPPRPGEPQLGPSFGGPLPHPSACDAFLLGTTDGWGGRILIPPRSTYAYQSPASG